MQFKLILFALVGSAYGISKIEKCIKDKCSPRDQSCNTNCVKSNVTPEELEKFNKCLAKCPSDTGTDTCSLGSMDDLLKSLNQQSSSRANTVVAEYTIIAGIAFIGKNYFL